VLLTIAGIFETAYTTALYFVYFFIDVRFLHHNKKLLTYLLAHLLIFSCSCCIAHCRHARL